MDFWDPFTAVSTCFEKYLIFVVFTLKDRQKHSFNKHMNKKAIKKVKPHSCPCTYCSWRNNKNKKKQDL